MGSCGTAAFRKEPVMNSDISNDRLWSANPAGSYLEVALRHGLRATWSQPLLSKDDKVLGTFAMYYAEPRSPSASDLQLIEGAARVALIAIQSDRSTTALQRAYQEIKQSEGRLRKIIDTIPTLAWRSLPDGTGEFWNRRWHDYTGLSPEAVRGWGWQDAIHPEDLKEITDKWLGFLASGQPGEVEGRLRRFDGTYRWFLFRAEPLRDESGTIVNWYGTDTDIEDLKQHEYELRRITDAIPQAIVVQQPDGTPIYANHVTLEYTGLTLEDVQAEGFREKIFHPDDLERVREVLPKSLR
jgi:PAS domain S-box-containing protein